MEAAVEFKLPLFQLERNTKYNGRIFTRYPVNASENGDFNRGRKSFLANWRASETLSGLFNRESYIYYILEKWFPLWGERAHSLKLFCMYYDKRFEI